MGLWSTSLTMGKAALPFGHRLVAHRQSLGQFPLGQALLGAKASNQGADFFVVHIGFLQVMKFVRLTQRTRE